MSRVSSASVKERAVAGFFASWPTPSDALEAEPADVLAVLSPLGLFENRWRSVLAISERFVTMVPRFEVGLTPELKIYGIGEFGFDSYRIFSRGEIFSPNDKTLAAYCRWARSVIDSVDVEDA